MAQAVAEDRLKVSRNKSFRDEIGSLSGQSIVSCYQCGECTAGCPVAYASDITPNQTMRMVQLNQEKAALSSSMIWLCVGCETCATRCPRGVELSKVMDALREASVQRGAAAAEPAVKAFHQSFLHSVQFLGRTHELSMIGEHKLRTRNFLADVMLGVKMFLKGKLVIMPEVIRGNREVFKIFRNSKKK